MIAGFVTSWPLFYHAYLTAWLISVLLATIGVLVVARDQIFLGAAVAQAATLGIAVGLLGRDLVPGGALPWLHTDSALGAWAVGCAMLAAYVTAQPRPRTGDSHEALTGWVFLTSASGAVLLVAHSPHGLAEIQRLLSSSLIGATAVDVWLFAACTAATLVAFGVWQRQLLLLALDPSMALAAGLHGRRWRLGLTLWLGLIVGLSLRASGLVYTFGCLVLPALIAKNLCRAVRPMFLVAPLVALGLSGLGCLVADASDTPPAQMTVVLLSGALALTWGWRWWRGRR